MSNVLISGNGVSIGGRFRYKKPLPSGFTIHLGYFPAPESEKARDFFSPKRPLSYVKIPKTPFSLPEGEPRREKPLLFMFLIKMRFYNLILFLSAIEKYYSRNIFRFLLRGALGGRAFLFGAVAPESELIRFFRLMGPLFLPGRNRKK